MGYKLIFLNADNSYVGRTRNYADGSEPADQTVIDRLAACVSKTIGDYDILAWTDAEWATKNGDDYTTFAWNSGDPIGDATPASPSDYLVVTTDATDSGAPADGIADIAADGTSTCTITVTKKKGSDDSTDTSGDETIYLAPTGGSLSTQLLTLSSGVDSTTLTSVAEQKVIYILATDAAGALVPGSIDIQFK